MALERMKKVAVFGMKQEFAAIAQGLQRLSMLHIDDIAPARESGEGQEDDQTLLMAQDRVGRVDGALTLLAPYYKKRGMMQPKPERTEQQLQALDNAQTWDTVFHILDIGQRIPATKAQLLQTENALETLRPYEKLPVALSRLRSRGHVFLALGEVQGKALLPLEAAVVEAGGVVYRVAAVGDKQSLLIIAHLDNKPSIEQALRDAAFLEASFAFDGTVEQERQRLLAMRAELDARMAEHRAELSALASEAQALQGLYDWCLLDYERKESALHTSHTQQTFCLTGWVRESKAQALEQALQKLSPNLFVQFPQPAEEDIPPTATKNGKLLGAFEAITNMYSVPNHQEADPTLKMAPFFLCFFGMMVSDAGYGIVLTILAMVFMRIAKPGGMMGQIVSILVCGGIATFLWGAVFGGWFGAPLLPPLWFNPLDDPMLMLILCLGLGIVHVSFGILLNAYALLKQGKVLDALFDCGFILGILWGAVATAIGFAPGLTIVFVCMGGIALTAGRAKKGILRKFTGGFGALYNLTGYLSDVLSYARLLGMGLATGVIGMVFNTLGGMLLGNPLGMVFGVAILIIGHTFNLAVNALGAYVHSCRLQYIEFYSKFFEGGGRAFVPFSLRTKYSSLLQSE